MKKYWNRSGCLALAALLVGLAGRADASWLRPWANRHLLDAAKNGDVDGMRKALTDGADINAYDDILPQYHYTALLWAAAYGRADAIRALLVAHPDLEAKDLDGNTALMIVDGAESAGLLIRAKADVHVVNRFGETVLMRDAGNVGITKMLLAAGASSDVNIADNFKGTPLMKAAEFCEKDDCAEAVTILLDAKAAVDAVDDDGETALDYAAMEDRPAAAAALLRAGADPNVQEKKNRETPLMFAAEQDIDDPALIAVLVKGGARVDVRGNEGITSLMLAANQGSLGEVKALLAAGADPTLVDDSGATALDDAEHARLFQYSAGTIRALTDALENWHDRARRVNERRKRSQDALESAQDLEESLSRP